jgi:uncharacterized protein (DUF2236 family)
MHSRIRGIDAAGRPYHALQPEAYAWVHLTLVHLFAEVRRLLGPPLSPAEKEELYAEWRQVGRLLGIRDAYLPSDWAAFRRYFDDTVEHTLESNDAVEDVLAAVARPQKPLALLPSAAWVPLAARVGDLCLLLTVGTLPAPLRERIGLPWTGRDAATLDRQAGRLRALFSVLPAPLFTLPPAVPYMVRARFNRLA